MRLNLIVGSTAEYERTYFPVVGVLLLLMLWQAYEEVS